MQSSEGRRGVRESPQGAVVFPRRTQKSPPWVALQSKRMKIPRWSGAQAPSPALGVASARSCPESPSRVAKGTSTPPREARIGDPGGCTPWVLARIFDKATEPQKESTVENLL